MSNIFIDKRPYIHLSYILIPTILSKLTVSLFFLTSMKQLIYIGCKACFPRTYGVFKACFLFKVWEGRWMNNGIVSEDSHSQPSPISFHYSFWARSCRWQVWPEKSGPGSLSSLSRFLLMEDLKSMIEIWDTNDNDASFLDGLPFVHCQLLDKGQS